MSCFVLFLFWRKVYYDTEILNVRTGSMRDRYTTAKRFCFSLETFCFLPSPGSVALHFVRQEKKQQSCTKTLHFPCIPCSVQIKKNSHVEKYKQKLCFSMKWVEVSPSADKSCVLVLDKNNNEGLFPLSFHPLSVSVSRCLDQACSPPIGNLAVGRALRILPRCCGTTTLHQHRCSGTPANSNPCQEDTHPAALMTDDPFLNADTWWASGRGAVQEDEIRLDLETKFCLSHVVLVFRSPRPAAMIIERSADFGQTWETLKVFTRNCSAEFDLGDDLDEPRSLCTSRYSSARPCSGGEVNKNADGCFKNVLAICAIYCCVSPHAVGDSANSRPK